MTRRVPPPSPGNLSLDQRLRAALEQERAASLDRRCPAVTGRVGLRYALDGREVVSFCSNDYLGLAGDDEDARAQASTPASGAAASRLVCGDLEVHRAVEDRFARLLGCEDAVLFPSGFQANVGVPAALLQAGELAYSDALNHASLIDGLRLSAARREIVGHLQAPPRSDAWWFVESVFSMDGDGPSPADIDTHLAKGGRVYLDEAHALGLYGGGRGRAAMLSHRPTVIMAPLGKAFGCAGAFVCGSSTVCEWVRGHARAFVFTTGVSPVLVERIAAAIERVAGAEGDRRREALWRNVELLRAGLGGAGLAGDNSSGPASPIFPVIVGDNQRALSLSAALLERGWHVQAIRPPTVPADGARLRITVSAAHEPASIQAFADDLRELLETTA